MHAQHGTKTTQVFLHADGEAPWSLLSSLVFLLSGGTEQPENTYSYFFKGYLHYKMITSQNMLSEEQVKNVFIL